MALNGAMAARCSLAAACVSASMPRLRASMSSTRRCRKESSWEGVMVNWRRPRSRFSSSSMFCMRLWGRGDRGHVRALGTRTRRHLQKGFKWQAGAKKCQEGQRYR